MKSALLLAAIAAGQEDEFINNSSSAAAREIGEKISTVFTGGNPVLTGVLTAKQGALAYQVGVYTLFASVSLALRAHARFHRDMRGDIETAEKLEAEALYLEQRAVALGPDFATGSTADEDEEIASTGTEG